MKKIILLTLTIFTIIKSSYAQETENNMENKEPYTFATSNNVSRQKVSFKNRYGITLVADLYIPKEHTNKKLSAIAISGPFGAVKEQSSGLYAQEMAERGFLTIAFDPSYTGESGGEPRYVASPDINTEDFCAAVDYLSNRDDVDAEKIGIIGICGWGGLALNAAAIDTRIKATVTITMYDMSRVNANGYFDSMDSKARYDLRKKLNVQRTIDAKNGSYALGGGLPDKLPEDAPLFVKDYYDYYKTKRGYHKRSLNSNNGWNITSALSFINMPLLTYIDEIRSAVLMIHGEKAHSRYFSEDAFNKLKGNNKELLIIDGASHVDMYDNKADLIPYERIESFFKENLKEPLVDAPLPIGEEFKCENFTAKVWLKMLSKKDDIFNSPIYNVTFEPGCINSWHKHPGGQILICLYGEGWYQEKGKEAQSIKKGDTIRIAPNVEHWHGAKKNSWFSHIAIETNPQMGNVIWLEKVDEDDYKNLK